MAAIALGAAMKTFRATALTDTAVSEDRRRVEFSFRDADGQEYAISLPTAIAANLVPVLETLTSAQPQVGELTRLPRTFAVGHASGERLVLLRFDDEAPYAIEMEMAEALAEQLQEQSEEVSDIARPALH